MEKRDTFSFGAYARSFVDQTDPRAPAALECLVEIVDGKADVVNTGSPLGDKLANW